MLKGLCHDLRMCRIWILENWTEFWHQTTLYSPILSEFWSRSRNSFFILHNKNVDSEKYSRMAKVHGDEIAKKFVSRNFKKSTFSS